MFIDEQAFSSIYDLKAEAQDEHWAVERYVWSPKVCRFTNWTYEPLCRCDARGNIIKGSRRRNPFIVRS